jgi:hypothetical protein
MSCGVVDRESTPQRFVSLKPRLLKCSKFATRNSGISQNSYLQAEVPHLQPLPWLENENHGEDIKS